ncbi:hypothetical protein LIER_42564 [Lithospermum erythrorhizon]|uniref:RNase H type-1 domain-containing protein n=1 Tax=Lithospermum erythrorhizon TaxID=34254 RepID=A0AAV3NIG3_LITER
MVILWALWEARNKAKHSAARYSFTQICQRVLSILIANGKANMTHAKFWTRDSYIARKLGAHTLVKQRQRPILLSWTRPMQGTLKLNIDAAFKDGKADYGGILRNDQGGLVCAKGIYGLCSSPLQAEVEALLSILQLCIHKGYNKMQIEVDSLQLVHMITGKIAHWKLYNNLAHIRTLLSSFGSHLIHIYRETNMIADWIAKHSCKKMQNFTWEDQSYSILQRLVQLDLGLPQIRFR